MSVLKKFQITNIYVYIVIELASCSIVLKNIVNHDDICGKGNSEVEILQGIEDTWYKIDSGHLIHHRAVLIFAQTVINLPLMNLRVKGLSNNQKAEYSDVSKVIIYPDYDPCHGINDFAVLILETSFSSKYSPICILLGREYKKCTHDAYHSGVYSATFGSNGEKCPMKPVYVLTNPEKARVMCDVDFFFHQDKNLDTLWKRITSRTICPFLDANNHVRYYYYAHNTLSRWCAKDGDAENPYFESRDTVIVIKNWIDNVIKENYID